MQLKLITPSCFNGNDDEEDDEVDENDQAPETI